MFELVSTPSRWLTLLLVCVSAAQSSGQAPVPELVRIPAGEFEMGSVKGGAWEKPVHRVATPEFEIGARPVTNREFRAFRPGHRSMGGNADGDPVTGVTWNDAADYCRWLSERTGSNFGLPSEAWWERAARGGLEGKDFPWGGEPPVRGPGGKIPPRANAFGFYAVTFQLWEWTADWYDEEYYSKSPRKDPRGPENGGGKVLRGGGFSDDPASAVVWGRASARPTAASGSITFRVARRSEPAPEATRAPPTQAAPETEPAPAQSDVPEPRPAFQAQPTRAEAAEEPAAVHAEVVGVSAIEASPEGGELVVRLAVSAEPRVKPFLLSSPDRLVLDFENTRPAGMSNAAEIAASGAGVTKVRYALFQSDPPTVRVVVDAENPPEYEVSTSPAEVVIRVRAGGP